ncbi:adenylosuccinate synthetase [Patescibacteria group bacterium]|nr:adenylosuccinate synthetase [Patescibacteria group bacterium]
MTKLDIIVDLQYGDSGKGKVAHFLCKKNKYTHVMRYNGGANAGHTIFHKGVKFVTHQIPVGVFFGVKSIIGPGCVVDPIVLKKEAAELEKHGIKVKGRLFVAKNAHIVTEAHKHEDGGDKKIGTTKRGIGPAYRDKFARIGVRAESVKSLKPYLIDVYEEFHGGHKKATVLCEGAQGFGLDIDWGDYPFVTSSHCLSGGALLNGFAPKTARDVWGIAKVYETYVGQKKFEPKDPVFPKIREIGEEYGATTGRPRQCNWLDIELLERAVRLNGVTHLVLSKMDVLDTVGVWKVREGKKIHIFKNGAGLRAFVRARLKKSGIPERNVHFSVSKDKI